MEVIGMSKSLYPKRVQGRTYRLCNYHKDSLTWDECSVGSKGCEVEAARKKKSLR